MDYEELSADENIVLAKRVLKRKEKRSEEECSDGDCSLSRRKKKPAPDTTDDEFVKPSPKPKKIAIPSEPDTEQLTEIKTYKKFVHYCNSLNAQQINEKNLRKIKEYVSAMLQTISHLSEENENLRKNQGGTANLDDKIRKLENVILGATNSIRELKGAQKSSTYADKLKAPAIPKPPERSSTPVRHVVAIYPRAGSSMKSSDATKETLVTSLAPAKEKLQIRGVKKISNNGVLVETATKEDMERVLKSDNLQAAGLVTGLPAKKKPRVIVYDVPNVLSESEFLTSLRQQNLNTSANEKPHDAVRISHKTGSRNPETANIVLEVSPRTRESLLKQDRVYVGWHSLRVRDYLTVSRCYKCQSFGHVSKHCRAAKEVCGHCGGDGHAFKDCPKKNENPVCINCRRAMKPCDHSSRSPECPAYKFALSNLISKIDYGD